jgi:hypothetical protein
VGWLAVLEILALMSILCVSSYNVSSPAGGSGSEIRSSISCTPEQLEAAPANFTSVVSAKQAAAISNSSPNYTAEASSLGPTVQINYTGVTDLSVLTLSTCSTSFKNFDVAYGLRNATNQSGQLSIWVNPTTGAVTNNSVQWMAGDSSHSSTGQWWGWVAPPCSSCAIHGTYAQWQNFGAGPSSNTCGATVVNPGVCALSWWGGLTATPNGGGSPRGIAQSGFNAAVYCSWVLFGFACGASYSGWVELWPQQSAGINCISIPSSGNIVASEVSWASPSTYYATIWDQSTGGACTTIHTMAMGTPKYGQFMAESIANPLNNPYDLPSFNFDFNPAVALGNPSNLNYGYTNTYNSAITVQNPVSFNSGACAGSGLSCFNEY